MKNKEIIISIKIKYDYFNIAHYLYKNFDKVNVEIVKFTEKYIVKRIKLENNMIDAMVNVSKYSDEIIRNKNTLWIKINNNELCKMIYSFNFIIIKAKFISCNTIIFNILSPSIYEIKKFEDNLKNNCISFEIIGTEYNENFELTEYQKEILTKLYEFGYFDDERKITLTESSELLNISAASLSETLRRTIKKIIEYYINNKL